MGVFFCKESDRYGFKFFIGSVLAPKEGHSKYVFDIYVGVGY